MLMLLFGKQTSFSEDTTQGSNTEQGLQNNKKVNQSFQGAKPKECGHDMVVI